MKEKAKMKKNPNKLEFINDEKPKSTKNKPKKTVTVNKSLHKLAEYLTDYFGLRRKYLMKSHQLPIQKWRKSRTRTTQMKMRKS